MISENLSDCAEESSAYARNGVAFDVTTGLPVPEVRQARAEAAKADELSWYRHALNYVARRRRGLFGKLHALDRGHPGSAAA